MRRARCFRCAGQDVSGVSGKLFQVCRARCFRCTGQDVSGAPGKMFQVRRVRCFRCAGQRCFRCAAEQDMSGVSGKMWQERRERYFRCAGQDVSGVWGKDSSMSHSTISLLPCRCAETDWQRSAVTVCLATQVPGKMVDIKINNYSKGHLGVDNRRPYSSDQRNRNKSKTERADYNITNQETAWHTVSARLTCVPISCFF